MTLAKENPFHIGTIFDTYSKKQQSKVNNNFLYTIDMSPSFRIKKIKGLFCKCN